MKKYIILPLLSAFIIAGCGKDENGAGGTGFNIFSVDDDITFGLQMDSTIKASPSEYPILSKSQFPEAYDYIEAMTETLLESQAVTYRDRFEWKVTIIRDDNTLNAFCTPGGYIYVYTGLIKYLDSEYELAGVVGHEIAHADRRHSTNQLTKQYGISTLLSIVLGNNPGLLAEISTQLISLKFSRDDESEADEYSVRYMCPSDYQADGAAEFFAKLIAEEQTGGTPEFLSTHPSPENRVEDIRAHRTEFGCTGTEQRDAAYADFVNGLP